MGRARGRLSRPRGGKYLEKREPSFYSFVARKPKAKLEFCGSGPFCASQSFRTDGSGYGRRCLMHCRERSLAKAPKPPKPPLLVPKYTVLLGESESPEKPPGKPPIRAQTSNGFSEDAMLKPTRSCGLCHLGETDRNSPQPSQSQLRDSERSGHVHIVLGKDQDGGPEKLSRLPFAKGPGLRWREGGGDSQVEVCINFSISEQVKTSAISLFLSAVRS